MLMGASAGCSEPLDETCGRGDALEVDGQTYCVYRQEIIEEGFDCPQDLQSGFQFENGVVCGPSNSNQLPPPVEEYVGMEDFGELVSGPEGWQVGEEMPNTSTGGGIEPFPAAPMSCSTGLPWQVTTQDATLTYDANGGDPADGALSISLDGAQGGEAFLRLPMGTGDFSTELDFGDMLQSQWGMYQVALSVHDPNQDQTYAMVDLATVDSEGRRACFGTIYSEGSELSSGGSSGCEDRAGDATPTTDGTIILRREGDKVWMGGYGMSEELDMSEFSHPIAATQPLDFIISVRGNTKSAGPVVRFEHLRASDNDGRLYDDAFSCDSTSPDTNFTPATPLEWDLNRGTGPRPTE